MSAKRKGHLDIQHSTCSGMDLLRHLKRCSKNIGHSDLIPIEKFRLSHLPTVYQDQDLLDWIKVLGDLTVRVDVTKSRCLSFGSGKICKVKKFTHETAAGSLFSSCPCRDCRESNHSSKTWGEFCVLTTTSVVSKETDFKNINCRLFYDSESSSVLYFNVVNVRTDEKFNRSWLTIATCDLVLVKRLIDILSMFVRLYGSVYEQYCANRPHITFMVSHPHGCAKRVSIGVIIEKEIDNEDFYSHLLHKTATCPGSGGAPIYVLNSWTDHVKYQHLHLKCLDNGVSRSTAAFDIHEDLNDIDEWDESGSQDGSENDSDFQQFLKFVVMITMFHFTTGLENRAKVSSSRSKNVIYPDYMSSLQFFNLQTPNSSQNTPSTTIDKGNTKLTEVAVNESDLHRDIKCEKNPGHKGFIPFEKFTLHHLPKDFQDNAIYDLIIKIAHVTVQMKIKMTSPRRPDFWPNSNVPYPDLDKKNKTNLRYGSGRVVQVSFFAEDNKIRNNNKTCTCENCQRSSRPSKIWGEIIIMTAAHAVFDMEEAAHTTCRLFYDRSNSQNVSLGPGGKIIWSDALNDFSQIKFVTCNLEIIQKLSKLVHDCDMQWERVGRKYQHIEEDVGRPVFIVSHPHGCSKQVSLGRVRNKINETAMLTAESVYFEYDANTCPGSSGAPVYILGLSNKNLTLNNFVHKGCNDGKNYSNNSLEVDFFKYLEENIYHTFVKFKNSFRNTFIPIRQISENMFEMATKMSDIFADDFLIPVHSSLLGLTNVRLEEPELD